MGVIIGSKAQGAVWEESADWLAKRSKARPPRPKRKAATKRKTTKRKAPKGKVKPKLRS